MQPQHYLGFGLLILIIAAAVFFKKRSAKKYGPFEVDLPRPDWISTTRLAGALISPTRTIYSTHMQTGNVPFIEYDGQRYNVTRQRVIETPRATSWAENDPTDITILDHDPVPPSIRPVVIADVGPDGEWGIAFLSGRTVECLLNSTKKTVSARCAAIPGDSSSPIVDAMGHLITLNSRGAAQFGYGPNLATIKNLLLD